MVKRYLVCLKLMQKAPDEASVGDKLGMKMCYFRTTGNISE